MGFQFNLAVVSASVALAAYYYQEVQNLGGKYTFVSICTVLLYLLYYSYFCGYKFVQSHQFTRGIREMGKTLPCFPNGWYAAMRCEELKAGSPQYLDNWGEHIALFRGYDQKVYAVEAYCLHMGANLAIGETKIVHENCIQCPFHGWVFDGETGKLVKGRTKEPQEVHRFEYNESLGTGQVEREQRLQEGCKEHAQLRKYPVLEMNGFIHIWIHSDPKREPEYYPLDISDYINRLQFRATSTNKVSAHVQDIVENGGDLKHFMYVHSSAFPFTDKISFEWSAKWIRGDDPELEEKMKHENSDVNKYKMGLLKRFLNEDNKKHIGVMTLNNSTKLPGLPAIFFFNGTIFQVGPGFVYLFLYSPFFEAVLFQHTTSQGKFYHELHHELYSNWYLPYWATALMIRTEAQQVINDGVIWDNKKFGLNPKYILNFSADQTLIEWRRWFAQFYEGCKEKEEERKKYEW